MTPTPTTMQQGGDTHNPPTANHLNDSSGKVSLDDALQKTTVPRSLLKEAELEGAMTESARNEARVHAAAIGLEDAHPTERTVAEVSCPAKIPTKDFTPDILTEKIKSSDYQTLTNPEALLNRERKVQSMQSNVTDPYSMNYTTPHSTTEYGNDRLEKIESRSASLDSDISENDTVDVINEKNIRLKLHLEDMIEKAEEQINMLHQGIPMEVKLTRRQLQRQVRRTSVKLEREIENKNITKIENEVFA